MKRAAVAVTVAAAMGLVAGLATTASAGDPGGSTIAAKAQPGAKTKDGNKSKLLYTTYFYTAAEAVIHGYTPNTKVKIVSLSDKKTIWSGKVGVGETKLVSTGRGVFGFIADKKASILVGTPSSCTAVGYWLRDEQGSFRAKRLFTQLPSAISMPDARVLVWAWEDLDLEVIDRGLGSLKANSSDRHKRKSTKPRSVHKGKVKAGTYFELTSDKLGALSNHVLEFKANSKAMAVQVYYDQGFFVPGRDGRAAGKEFYTYVGKITDGDNELQLISPHTKAKVSVVDLKADKVLFKGTVQRGQIHSLSLRGKYVQVSSDVEINVAVAPHRKFATGYAEHHYGAGSEGTGIETSFLLTSPKELWIFSYYDGNEITITDKVSGKKLFGGILKAGNVRGVHPGHGYYEVRSTKGVSVMGGQHACGAEYSPASGLFAIDEAVYEVVEEIRQERIRRAHRKGRTLTKRELNAPLNEEEAKRASDNVKKRTKRKNYAPAEASSRADDIMSNF